MKLKQVLFGISASASLLATSAVPVFAQSPSTAPWQQKIEDRQKARQERQDQRQEKRVERRCDLINNRIDARITRYNKNYDEVEARISRVNKRMNELVDKLESKGYDVSTVRSDIQTLEEMRTTRRSYYTTFIQKLEATKQSDCADSEGAFKSALNESKTALADYRAQVKSVWNYIKNTLKPDLQALKGQNPNPTTTE